MIEEKLQKEINILENNLSWAKEDQSQKERLSKSKLKSYIDGAKYLMEMSSQVQINFFICLLNKFELVK